MRAAAIIAAGLAHSAAGTCTGSVKQQITVSRQGNGWFTSLSSERKSVTANTLPARLSFWAQEDGMMTYGDTRSGAVLSFTGCTPPANQTPYLHIVWNATGATAPYGNGAPVLRVDATNCGTQRSDVSLFNQDCVAKNTNTAADVACYCMPVPCVLKGVAPAKTSWMLNATDHASTDVMLPIPAAYFGSSGLTIRVTPLYSTYATQLSEAVTIISAAIEYPTKTPAAPQNVSASDSICYGY